MSNWNQYNSNDEFGGVKPAQGTRDPFIPAHADPMVTNARADHTLIVVSIEVYFDQKWGPTVRGIFEVEQSTIPTAVGSTFAKLWNLRKPSAYPTQETDTDNFVDFVCKAQGAKFGEHGAACIALTKTRHEHPGGQLESQPARGVRVRCSATSASKIKMDDRGQPKPPYVKCAWLPVEQNLEMIARTRSELDRRRPYFSAPTGYQPAPAPQMQQAPQAYGQQYPASQTMQQIPQGGGFTQYVQPAPQSASQQPQYGTQLQQTGQYGQLPPQGGGCTQYVQPAPTGYQPAPAMPVPANPQMPAVAAPAVAPWNPAWGPKPAGYPG